MKSQTPIQSKYDILSFFQEACVPEKDLLIGLEVERSGVFDKDLSPVQYLGTSGYLAILKKLVEEVGWQIINQDENGNITSLKRGESEIHIEDDGRIELVSKPRKGLFSLSREYQMHVREINAISKEFDVRWISMGWQPFSTNKEISYAFPRKAGMFHRHYKNYYNGWNKNAHILLEKKNNGIHVNFGYTSEQDAVTKFQTMLKISPILVAMFANSPLNAKKYSGFLSNRPRNTALCYPDKNNIREMFFQKDFSFEKWVDFLLKLPMNRIKRGGKEIFVPLSFSDYLKNGFKKYTPRIDDFYLHIKTTLGEIRMKHYIEYRGIDCVPPHLIPSIPAIIRALTLNPDVMKECRNLVKNWTFSDHLEMRSRIYKYALQAETPDGGKVLNLAKKLLEIASSSLEERHRKIRHKIDASRFLWPIKEYILVREQSPAEYLMEMWNGAWHRDPRKLLEWSEK